MKKSKGLTAATWIFAVLAVISVSMAVTGNGPYGWGVAVLFALCAILCWMLLKRAKGTQLQDSD